MLIAVLLVAFVLGIAFGGSFFFNLAIFGTAIAMLFALYNTVEIGLKMCDKKIENIRKIISENPDNAEAYYDLAVLYSLRDIGSDDREKGIEQFRYFIHNFPNHPLKSEAESAIRKLQDRRIFWRLLAGNHGIRLSGSAYSFQGMVQDALNAYKKKLEADPSDGNSLFGMASVLSKSGDFKGAIEHINRFQKSIQGNKVMDMQFGTWESQKVGNIIKRNISKVIAKLENCQPIGSFEEEFAVSAEEKRKIKEFLLILMIGIVFIVALLVWRTIERERIMNEFRQIGNTSILREFIG